MYASSDAIIVMMMFFGLFLLRIPKRDSNPQPSDRRWDALPIELLELRWLSKNSSKNIVITMISYSRISKLAHEDV